MINIIESNVAFDDKYIICHQCYDSIKNEVIEYLDRYKPLKITPYHGLLRYDPGGMFIVGLPNYNIGDILLVDCQHVEILQFHLQRKFTYRGKSQWVRFGLHGFNLCLSKDELEHLKKELTRDIIYQAEIIYQKKIEEIKARNKNAI